MANNKKSPVAHASRGDIGRNAAVRIQWPHQVRATAPQSLALTPLLMQVLGAWNQSSDALEQQLQKVAVAAQALKQLRDELHPLLTRFRLDEGQYLATVEQVSQGNPVTIRSLGCPVQVGKALPPSQVAAPTDLVVKMGADPGAVHLSWAKAAGAKAYALQLSPDPVTATSWVSLPGDTKRRRRVGDLVTGARYWFRVATLGANGQSGWSEPVYVTARLARRQRAGSTGGGAAEDAPPPSFFGGRLWSRL